MSGRVLIALLTLFGRAPLPALRALGWLLGQVLYGLAGSRRRIVLTNLGLCFPDLDPGARKRLARRTLVAFAQSWLDRGWLWHAPEKTLLQRLRLQGALFELEGNRPVVLFAPHFMGLDAAWTALTLRLPRRLVTIYSPQKSAATDRWMHTGRQRWGQPTQVPRGDGVRPVLQALRAGQPLYLLPDMNFDPSESLFVPFFGVTACTVTSLPRFARLGRAKVVPVVARMTPLGYDVMVLPAWADYPSANLESDVRRMNVELEGYIKPMPEQYYWLHRRFKDQPAGAVSPY